MSLNNYERQKYEAVLQHPMSTESQRKDAMEKLGLVPAERKNNGPHYSPELDEKVALLLAHGEPHDCEYFPALGWFRDIRHACCLGGGTDDTAPKIIPRLIDATLRSEHPVVQNAAVEALTACFGGFPRLFTEETFGRASEAIRRVMDHVQPETLARWQRRCAGRENLNAPVQAES